MAARITFVPALLLVACVLLACVGTTAFRVPAAATVRRGAQHRVAVAETPAPTIPTLPASSPRPATTTTALSVFGKKKKKEDLSDIEVRDMTREEMLALNKQNEEIMNAELFGMTLFSLVISLPLLYLAWVGFFAETAEIAGDLSDI